MPNLPEPGPSEAANFGEPSRPRLAASILLLRDSETKPQDGASRLEVLMLKRSAESHFMPSVWVFPGGSLDQADGDGLDGLRRCAARELREEAGVRLEPTAELTAFSRWITPEQVKVRYDTWFFLTPTPPGITVEPDGFEMTEAVWISPAAAVEAAEAGEMAIVFPTRKQLEGLLAATDTASAIEQAKANPEAERPVLPKVIGTKDDYRVVLPGDPDYPVD